MLIVFVLGGVVLSFSRSMRVEMLAASNTAAAVQASAIERGAEQYVIAALTQQTTKGVLPDLDEEDYKGVQVGDGYFWVLRPDYGDNSLPLFGLVDESSKLNINVANYDALMKLPNMTTDIASAIVSYRSADSGGTGTPLQQGNGYYIKYGPFETVEELLLVQGVDRPLLYGNGQAAPLGEASGGIGAARSGAGLMTDLSTAQGINNFLTIYSKEPVAATTGGASSGGAGGAAQKINLNDPSQRDRLRDLLQKQLGTTRGNQVATLIGSRDRFVDVFDFYFRTQLKVDEFDRLAGSLITSAAVPRARINVNTASREVLLTLPGLESGDVDKLISQRSATTTSSPTLGWVAQTLDKKAIGLADQITGSTSRVSADILAISGNGRAFKRVRIVIGVSGTTPQVIYRRDLSDQGFPMDPALLDSLRAGQGAGAWMGYPTNGSGGSGGMSR